MTALAPHPALARRAGGRELCQLVDNWKGAVPIGGAIVEPKVDGFRALWIDGELVTREGTPLAGADHIAARLRQLEHEACMPMFFDGEYQVDGSFGRTLAHFRAFGGNGSAGTLQLFDAMPMRVWRGEDACDSLELRRDKLDRLVKGKEDGAVRLMPWAFMTDVADIEARAREYIAAGGEGVVVKQATATYQRNRCGLWQRIKRALTVDLPILRLEPDRAKPYLLGVMVLDRGGREIRVRAGFSDAQRMAFWRDRGEMRGAIAEIEAMEITEAGALRSPRFVRMRADKGR